MADQSGNCAPMRQRYFIIEPKYSDPDTFCNFIVGSDRVRASIQIYADIDYLREAAAALASPSLLVECAPSDDGHPDIGDIFGFDLVVAPHAGEDRLLKFRIFQDWLDDGAPFRAEIRFELTAKEATAFSQELAAWCNKPEYAFIWQGD